MYARHDLVWLSHEGWLAVYAGACEETRSAIAAWRAAGRPVVVRRADADVHAGSGVVCAGIALPPAADGGKQRIALRVRADHVRSSAAAMLLTEALPALPARWQPGLAALAATAAAQGISLRLYGSAALQALTGLRYVTGSSDIDLLFQPADRAQLDAGMRLLSEHARALPLDGEVVFPCGGAVAWKEWAAASAATGAQRVLVKEERLVRLRHTGELLGNLKGEPCAMT